MSLQTRIQDFVTAVATDIKGLRTSISGDNTGTLTGLNTTTKTSLVSAINEVNSKPTSAAASPASESIAGVLEVATQPETDAGTADNLAVTPLKFQTRLAAYAQAKSSNLTALDIASTAYGRAFLGLVDQAGLMGLLSTASTTVSGIVRLATTTETAAATPSATLAVTPAGVQGYAQAKSNNLTALDIASTAYGRGFLALANQAGLMGLLSTASTTVTGIVRLATQTEVNTGTDAVTAVSPATFQTRLAAYAQPLDADLTSIAALSTTTYGRAFLALVDQAGLMGLIRTASETVTGVLRTGTQAEHTTGTADNVYTTPLKLQQKLTAWAQPLSANLTTLAGVASGAFGRTLLGAADAPAARTSLGLAAVATSGSASDITTGTLPTNVLPALAINETFVVATQAAQLALVAQRGDVAVRTDISRTFILTTDDPTVFANWSQITAQGDVVSVAGKTGTVSLVKGDVGLGNVDNTADADKPVSTLQQTALDLRLAKASNLSDLASAATARTNLGVYSTADIGNPETDLVAAYNTAKA